MSEIIEDNHDEKVKAINESEKYTYDPFKKSNLAVTKS